MILRLFLLDSFPFYIPSLVVFPSLETWVFLHQIKRKRIRLKSLWQGPDFLLVKGAEVNLNTLFIIIRCNTTLNSSLSVSTVSLLFLIVIPPSASESSVSSRRASFRSSTDTLLASTVPLASFFSTVSSSSTISLSNLNTSSRAVLSSVSSLAALMLSLSSSLLTSSSSISKLQPSTTWLIILYFTSTKKIRSVIVIKKCNYKYLIRGCRIKRG